MFDEFCTETRARPGVKIPASQQRATGPISNERSKDFHKFVSAFMNATFVGSETKSGPDLRAVFGGRGSVRAGHVRAEGGILEARRFGSLALSASLIAFRRDSIATAK